jgi:hypothetical protein
MAAHLYWRLNITENNGEPAFLAISEVEMRATVGGADQCSGGTATASTSGGGAAANAFDNSASTRWSTDNLVLTGWLRYQFAAPVDIVEYTIQAHPIAPDRSPKNWTLEYSDNGSSWTVADTRSNQVSWLVSQIRTFSPFVSAPVPARSHVFVCT